MFQSVKKVSEEFTSTSCYHCHYQGNNVFVSLLLLGGCYALCLFHLWAIADSLREPRLQTLEITVVVAVMALLITLQGTLAAHRTSRSHLQLKEAFLKVQEGDFSVRLESGGGATPEELEPAFNRMMDFLEQRK